MDAVRYIEEHMNPRKIMDHYGFRNITDTEESLRASCAIHNGDNPSAFIWNKSNNLWFCYTGNCHGGDVFTLIQKMEKVTFIESVNIAASILELDISEMKIKKQRDIVLKNTLEWLETMKRFQKKNTKMKEDSLPFTKYTVKNEKFSRFNEEILNFYQAKFCNLYPTEEKLLYNKLVIPIIFKGITVGVALRDTTGIYQPKWYYQPDSIEIRKILYNYDLAVNTIKTNNLTSIILVEGVFDVWAYHQIGIDNVVAVFGSSLKKEQANLLLKLGIDLILSFDNDNAGNKAAEAIQGAYSNKVGISIITLPEGKDPSDCSEEELLQCYMRRKII